MPVYLHFFLWIQVTVCHHVYSPCRVSFSISCKMSLLETKSLDICLSGYMFISPSFLKTSFVVFRIFFFFLSTLWRCHSIAFKLYCFWLKVSKQLYCFSIHEKPKGFQQDKNDMSCCVFLCVYPSWDLLSSLNL